MRWIGLLCVFTVFVVSFIFFALSVEKPKRILSQSLRYELQNDTPVLQCPGKDEKSVDRLLLIIFDGFG